jgi:hypothetical protein
MVRTLNHQVRFMATPLALFLFLLLLSSAALLWATTCKERRIKSMEKRRIIALQHKVQAVLQDGSGSCFTETLAKASITTGLQLPRLKAQNHLHRQVPEKYQILERLASQGLNQTAIASALGISTMEAGQLLALRQAGTPHPANESDLKLKHHAHSADTYLRGILQQKG